MEQVTNQAHHIHFKNKTVLAKQPHYTNRVICEATEINLQQNFNNLKRAY